MVLKKFSVLYLLLGVYSDSPSSDSLSCFRSSHTPGNFLNSSIFTGANVYDDFGTLSRLLTGDPSRYTSHTLGILVKVTVPPYSISLLHLTPASLLLSDLKVLQNDTPHYLFTPSSPCHRGPSRKPLHGPVVTLHLEST